MEKWGEVVWTHGMTWNGRGKKGRPKMNFWRFR